MISGGKNGDEEEGGVCLKAGECCDSKKECLRMGWWKSEDCLGMECWRFKEYQVADRGDPERVNG